MRVLSRPCIPRTRVPATAGAAAVLLVLACIPLPSAGPSIPIFNFHVIDPGRAYRSAQPDPEGLRTAIVELGLKTVLNLRDAHPGEAWYDAEKAVCDELNVTLASFPMSAHALPAADVLADVIRTLQEADYPILIHCQGGADRTGAVSALYRIVVLGQDKAQAAAELTPATLHFYQYAPCMDRLIELFEPTPDWLAWYAEHLNEVACEP